MIGDSLPAAIQALVARRATEAEAPKRLRTITCSEKKRRILGAAEIQPIG